MSKPIRKSSKNKVIFGALALIFVVSALFLAMFAVRTKTNIAPQAAIMSGSSNLVLVANKKTAPKDGWFKVDVRLDNSEDMTHVVTGIDAIIKYDPSAVEPVKIINGKIFKTLTNQSIDPKLGLIEISGSFSSIKDSSTGMPKGYEGHGDIFATINFKTKKLGKTNIQFVYRGGQDTTDSNIVAFKKDKPVSGQMPQERFLQKPVTLSMNIANEPSPTPAPLSNRCEPCNSTLPSSAPNSRCSEGLVCVYEEPTDVRRDVGRYEVTDYKSGITKEGIERNIVGASGLCVKKEENINSCSKPTPTPSISPLPTVTPKPGVCTEDAKKCPDGSYVSRVAPDCNFARCPVPPVSPTPTPSPRPEAKIQIKLDLLGIDNFGSINKQWVADGFVTKGTLYGIDTEMAHIWAKDDNVKGVSVATTLGDLNNEPIMVGRPVESSPPVKYPIDRLPPQRGALIKIANFTTDSKGIANIVIPQNLEGKRMQLFVRTQSHLRKSGPTVALPKVPDCLWTGTRRCKIAINMPSVTFSNLIPGDIYMANKQQEQDNVINTFDAMELIRSIGKPSVMTTMPIQCFKEPCGDPRPAFVLDKADLNADSVVNIRDLKILMDNFSEKGDEPGISSIYYKR